MKFIITESRMERIISKYLDLQGLTKIEKNDNIFFLDSSDEGYFQIVYIKDDGSCFIYVGLINYFSSFFSLDSDVSEELIGKWVENTLQMKVSNTNIIHNNRFS